MVRSASLSCLMFVVAAASCGDNGTEPPVGPPGLTIVSGAGANDTVDARLVQALVVEVHTPAGRAAYESLASYPADARAPIIRKGLASRDREIRAICERVTNG